MSRALCVSKRSFCVVAGGVVWVGLAAFVPYADAAIRIATYNVDDDTGLADHNANIAQAIEDMAARSLAGNAQALDVISLQELHYTTPAGAASTTLTGVVNALNAVYGAGAYAYSAVGATTGNSTGNGPNGLIYNTKTIKVLATKPVGTPDGDGESRAPMRYQLQSLSYTGTNTFYLYSEHTKAMSGTDNALRRTYEMDAVRADADALGSSAHVLFTGDYNLTGGSSEAGYQDLTAASGTTLSTNGDPNSSAANIVAGATRAYDPLISSFSTSKSALVKYYTESDDDITARFDLQLTTANVLASNFQPGLQLVPNTETAFGNSYYNTSGVLSSVLSSGGTILTAANYNTSVTGYTQAVLQNLLDASDHLPVVADYVIAVPEPASLAAVGLFGLMTLRRRRA